MARFFQALGNPIRLSLLNLIGEQEICVCELVAALGQPQPMISQHLAWLRSVGVVTARRQGKWMHYRIAQPAHQGAAEVLDRTLAWMKTDAALCSERQLLATACCGGPESYRSGPK